LPKFILAFQREGWKFKKTSFRGIFLNKKSESEKIPESMMRLGRKDPTGWVLFIPIKDEKVKVEKID